MIIIGADYDVLYEALISGYSIRGIVDPNKNGKYEGVEILGGDEHIFRNYEDYKDEKFVIAVDDEKKRGKIYDKYENEGFEFGHIDNSENMELRDVPKGSIFMRGSFVGKKVDVGKNVKISYNVELHHDVCLGTSCIVAPSAVVLGYVSIGDRCYIGANSTICPRVSIGEGVKVGAGSTVADNISNNTTVMGYYPIGDISKAIPRA